MNTLAQASNVNLGQVDLEARQSSVRFWGQRLTVLILVMSAVAPLIGFQAYLSMLMLVGFAAAILGLRRPGLGLLGIGMLCTLDAPASTYLLTGGLLRWNTLNYWLLAVMLLSLPFLLRLKDLHTRLLQALVLVMGVGLLYTTDIVGGIQHIIGIISLFGLITYFALGGRDKLSWYWLGIVSGTLSGAGGFTYFLMADRLPYLNPNAWTFFPLTGLFALCLAFYNVIGESDKQFKPAQLVILSLAAVNFVWVVLSGSRGGILIAFVCLVFLILIIPGFSRRLAYLIVGFLVALAVLTQFANLENRAFSRIDQLLDPNLGATSRTAGRYDLAMGGWYIFLENPFGVGTGSFSSTWASHGSFEGRLGGLVGQEYGAHSAWIKTLAENGILGVLLLASYVVSFAFVGWRKSREDRKQLLLGLLATGLLGITFVSREFQGKGLWLLVAGVTTLLHRNDIVVRSHRAVLSDRPATSAGQGSLARG